MNLQNIDRLKQLLSRVEKNARLPHTHTQGLGAGPVAVKSTPKAAEPFAAPAPVAEETPSSVGIAPPPATIPGVAAQAASNVAIATSKVEVPLVATTAATPVSLAPDLLEPAVEELELEDVSLEDIAAVELEIDEDESVEVEVATTASAPETEVVSSELVSSGGWNDSDLPPSAAPQAADVKSPAPLYTAPPSLDELTFSEPPPPPDGPSQGRESVADIEPPPISAAQAISEPPDSIDAALLAASQAQSESNRDADDETLAVTPPPESGPQVAVPPLGAPGVPSELRGEAGSYRPYAPTIEQLGDVIDLDQSSGPPLELARPSTDPESRRTAPPSQPEELEYVPQLPVPSRPIEAREPMQTLVGGFTEEADTDSSGPHTPPPQARIVVPSAELMTTEERGTMPIQTALPQLSMQLPAQGSFGDEAPTAASSVLVPEVTARGPVAMSQPAVNVVASARTFQPSSFLELLDASVALLK